MPIIKGSKKKEDSLRMALELTQIRNILCLIIGRSFINVFHRTAHMPVNYTQA